MDPKFIGGNDSCQKLRLISDHHEVFGASVETSSDFAHLQEVLYPFRAHSLRSQFAH